MLLIGPPGSGKTERILRSLEQAIRARRGSEVLLLVPTGSMKNHLLNLLARRGLMVPARIISTMSEFVRNLSPDAREAGGAVEDRLLRAAIQASGQAGFGARSSSNRLRGRISSLMGEFWAAGADSFQLEPAVRTAQQRAFLGVFREYEATLARGGFAHHNQRIAKVAAQIRQKGLGTVRSVYVDGFDLLTKQQEELLDALDEQAEECMVAMGEGLPHYPRSRQREQLPPGDAKSRLETVTVEAASPRAEVLEIARRILASERPLHEHAVIVRSPEQYQGLLREIFETLHIPHRFWSRASLADHGVTQHFLLWLRIIARRFPAEDALEAITSPLSPVGGDAETDAFDFAVRERLPGSGLEFLVQAAQEFPTVATFLAGLQRYERWHKRRVGAPRWKRECLELLGRIQGLQPPVDAESFQRTCDWRGAISARQGLLKAIDAAAELPDIAGRKRPSLERFASALEDVLRATVLAVPDQRFDVVHILPVTEARQWSIPVAFVCGLAEGWFPRGFSQDIFFDDEDRLQMRGRGIGLRTTADRAREERLLFEIATTRAVEQQVLSYPRHDSTGQPLVRSSLLAEDAAEALRAPSSRLGDPGVATASTQTERLPASLLAAVADCNQRFSVSGIGNFRQCPYRFFSANTLSLRGRPALPERRLDALALGMIVHAAIDRWNRKGGQIGQLLDRAFGDKLRDLHLGESYRTERYRLALRADLVRFADNQVMSMAIPDGTRSRFEEDAGYRIEELDSRPVVQCRIDRYDVDTSQRCFVTDYKYARPSRVKELLKQHLAGEELQLVLYLAALEQQLNVEPTGMVLCGLRGEPSFEGAAINGTGGLRPLSEDEMKALLDSARTEAADAVGQVLGGGIAVQPRDRDFCRKFCEFGGICRVDWQPAPGPDRPEDSGV